MRKFKFSNFYEFRPAVKVEGLVYRTPEHLYQSRKAVKLSDRKRIADASSPAEAKKIGNHVQMRKGWDEHKIEVMEWIQKIRFNQPYWEKQLLESTDCVPVVEYNWWHDNFWGSCLCSRCLNKQDKLNHLGIIIQKIKDGKEKK